MTTVSAMEIVKMVIYLIFLLTLLKATSDKWLKCELL